MTEKSESKKFETLVEEADELMRQINSDFIGDMQEEYHQQPELQAQNLKKTKSEMDATDALLPLILLMISLGAILGSAETRI